jgi:hypothetical protein
LFQESYSLARKIINTRINRNIKRKKDTSPSKIVHQLFSEIKCYNTFLESLHNEWSTSLVYIILDITGSQKNDSKEFLRKCVKECNVMILKKNDILVEYSS